MFLARVKSRCCSKQKHEDGLRENHLYCIQYINFSSLKFLIKKLNLINVFFVLLFSCLCLWRSRNGREARNRAEKHRRDKLNGSIQELSAMVPHVSDSPRRVDKTAVLRFSAHGLRIDYGKYYFSIISIFIAFIDCLHEQLNFH